MNHKLKKFLIVLSSAIILFAGVFFMTRSISNLVDASNSQNVVSSQDKNNTSENNSETEKEDSSKNTEEKTSTEDEDNKKDDVSKKNDASIDYVVKSGDSLSGIVTKLMPWCSKNEAIKTITEMNNLKNSEVISVGSHLTIPQNPIDTADCIEHKVVKGDTLYKIATKYFPSTNTNEAVKAIMDKNNISDPKSVTENRVIYIPKDNVQVSNVAKEK